MPRRLAPRAAPLRREDKLLLLAAGLYVVAALASIPWGGGVPRGALVSVAVVASLAPLHLGLLHLRPSPRAVWAGAALAAAACAVLGVLAAPAAVRTGSLGLADGQWATAWRQQGWIGVVACGLLFLVPALHFADAAGRRDRAPVWAGRSGLTLVAAFAALGVFAPVITTVVGAAIYVLAVAGLYAGLREYDARALDVPVKREQTLSVTVIAKNEADRIAPCLRSVAGWSDEIVVLDSGSTDGTVELVRQFTDRVWVTDWPGYGPQKQRALERATCDWVLSIDADEEVTPELRRDIDLALTESPACVGYKLPWGVIVYGKMLDFGRSARAPLRLFRREGSRFTDDQVHETVVLPPGPVGRLRGRLLHYTQRDFGHALDKVATYGWLGAKKRHAAGRRGGGLPGAVARGLLVFVQVYVVRLGFLDGGPGFLTAMLYAQVAFDKYAGLWALRREERRTAGITGDER